jgi:hypothetical protein
MTMVPNENGDRLKAGWETVHPWNCSFFPFTYKFAETYQNGNSSFYMGFFSILIFFH